MSMPNYASPDHSVDLNNVKLLAIFHFVLAGITGLCSLFPLIYVFMGLLFLRGNFPQPVPAGPTPTTLPVQQMPQEFGYIFIAIGLVGSIFTLSLAVLMLTAGIKLLRQRSRVFCMVVAGIECIFLPFGTVLGIFTLILLNKESVKPLFNPALAQAPAYQPPQPPPLQPWNDPQGR